ncbi:MAG TPA: hypothetical protein DD979_18165, partial [Gammaproteobacteria bacterium]|nr:hypothetical protein [Gammaproteobacteria bacterium]
LVLLVLLVMSLLVGMYIMRDAAIVGSGYQAKKLCSHVFLAGRSESSVMQNELEPFNPLMSQITHTIDHDAQSVTATAFRLISATAVYRPGYGCTLSNDDAPPLPALAVHEKHDAIRATLANSPWPTGDDTADRLARNPGLEAVVDQAFSEPSGDTQIRTRAVVIVHKGQIVAERYAQGFDLNRRFHSWSITKSLTSALIGALEADGKLSRDELAPVAAWRTQDSPHSDITITHLLQMSGGFDFAHNLSPIGKRQLVLFGGVDTVAESIDTPLQAAPGSRWEYANPNPHVLAGIVGDIAGGLPESVALLNERLLLPTGMRNTVIEPDAFGNLVVTSFGWASARDWARLGLLYLNNGNWAGQQLLPEDWVEFSTTPAAAAAYENYGALWWLNRGIDNPDTTPWAGSNPPFWSLPADAYFAIGHEGNYLGVFPSQDLVIVRLGLTRDRWAWRFEPFARQVLDVLEAQP